MERDRFAFVARRDGEAAARRWAADTIATYRRAVLDRQRWTMYRRPMIERYLSLRRILAEAD